MVLKSITVSKLQGEKHQPRDETCGPFLARGSCQPTRVPVPVDGFGDLLDVRVPSESFKEWPNEDNLKDFLCRILSYPARIQDSQSPTVGSSSLFSHRLKSPSKLG